MQRSMNAFLLKRVSIPHGGLGTGCKTAILQELARRQSPSHAVGLERIFEIPITQIEVIQSPSHAVGLDRRTCGGA
jgi:hypothetical protein